MRQNVNLDPNFKREMVLARQAAARLSDLASQAKEVSTDFWGVGNVAKKTDLNAKALGEASEIVSRLIDAVEAIAARVK